MIVVKDGPGFYTTRVLAPYLNEAMKLLAEGASIEQIDKEAKRFGFPVGPLTLLDEVGVDVGAHVSRDLGRAFAARGHEPSDILTGMASRELLGKKSGRGFYIYGGRRRRVNGALYEEFALSPSEFAGSGAAGRLALAMANEAARCLDEGVVASPRDADTGAVLGLGFPPFRGGPLHWMNERGVAATVDELDRLAERYGRRFEPAEELRARAREGRPYQF